MCDKSNEKQLVGVAGVDSLNVALDLLRERASKTDKRKRRSEDSEDKTNKVAVHCTSHERFSPIDREKTNAALGFSENYAFTEMRSCLSRHDWAGLCRIFPLILGCYNELEPIVWRYIITILLCAPDRDSLHFQEFLEMCIGAQNLENSDILERLLSLQHRTNCF